MKGSSFSMKLKKLISVAAAAVLSAAMFTGCGSKAPENTVFSIDDLNGKKIGVQLGTVGDTYASDVEGATTRALMQFRLLSRARSTQLSSTSSPLPYL